MSNSPENHAAYYKHAFPFQVVHRLFAREWQARGPGPDKREYGVETYPDGVYRRWKACPRPEDLQAFVRQEKFGKLNIGAVFDKCPLERWRCSLGNEPKPVLAEFRIDVDLGDYEYLGIPATNLAENDLAFGIAGVAIEVFKAVLKTEFGFEHFLPVYSGRRGAHLWVLDKRACYLSDAARKAILDFLSPGQRVHASGRKTFRWLLKHPAFGVSGNSKQQEGVFCQIVYRFFQEKAVKSRLEGGLGLLDHAFDRSAFLTMIDERFALEVATSVRSAATGSDALMLIVAELNLRPYAIRSWLYTNFNEAVCTLVWPRADTAVSTHMNHTLKSPFSVHPGTGRVSVPILYKKRPLWKYDPATEAPMASGTMSESFRELVLLTTAFIDAVARSPTETWEPPDLSLLEPISKRVCYNLTSAAAADDTPVRTEGARVAWVVMRSLSLFVDDAGVVHFEMATHARDHDRPSVVIPAWKSPPFDHRPGDKHSAMLDQTLGAISNANTMRNTAFGAFSWQQVIIVETAVQDAANALRRVNVRFERLRERLEESEPIGVARVNWGELAISSFVRQQLWPYLDELRSL